MGWDVHLESSAQAGDQRRDGAGGAAGGPGPGWARGKILDAGEEGSQDLGRLGRGLNDEPRVSGPAQGQRLTLGLVVAQGDILQVRSSGPDGLPRRWHWEGERGAERAQEARGNSVTFNRENCTIRTTTSGTAGSQGSVGYVLEQFDDVVHMVLVELAADGVLLLLEDLEFCSTDPRV